MGRIAIGKVRTSVGVKGYFKVLSFSGETQHFKRLKGKEIDFQSGNRLEHFLIEDVRMSGSNLTMKVEGIETPEAAKKLSGWEIYVDRSSAASLAGNEYYLADLYGCRLVCSGKDAGMIIGICDNGLSDLLEVDTEKGTRLIPFMDIFVGKVDLEEGTVELREDWLLE